MTIVQRDIWIHKCKFVLQHQRVYTPTQQLRHGMESLRHTFQLGYMAGRSHCRLCSLCLSGTYKLRPSKESEHLSVRHIVLYSRMFLSAWSELQIMLI
jgi:hypothetical protein